MAAPSDWSQNDDPAIRFYSGTAVYKNTVSIAPTSAGARQYLDLGKVGAMAKVKINGKYAGGAWTPPYRVDITGLTKEGDNEVEIEIVNTWQNRIIGDAQLPEAERILKPASAAMQPDKPLQESGLLETPKIIEVKY